MPNSFTIGSGTTLAQLDQFLKNDVDKGKELRARTNSQGETVLYAKTTLSSIVDRLTGRTQERREAARAGIESVFSRYQDAKAQKGASGEGTELLFRHVGNVLAHKANTSGITAADVHEMRQAAKLVVRNVPHGASAEPAHSPRPTLADTGLKQDNQAFTYVARVLAAADPQASGFGDDMDAMGNALGDEIADQFKAKFPWAYSREEFALSDGVVLKQELRNMLDAALGEFDPKPQVTGETVDAVVERAFLQAASTMLSDRAVDDTSTRMPGSNGQVELPNVTLGGDEYAPTRLLGSGGFGDVYEYAATNGSGDKVALKLAIPPGDDDYASPDAGKLAADAQVREAAAEVKLHRAAVGSGCDQVIGLKGVLRLPDGRVGIAVELAPNGTAHDVAQTIRSAVNPAAQPGTGRITEPEANILRLTMIRDMALGLDHLHTRQGITHFDFKSPNCFVGEDGTAKVADFGGSIETPNEIATKDEAILIGNLSYKAPEVDRMDDAAYRIDTTLNKDLSVQREKVAERLAALLPNLTPAGAEVLTSNIMARREEEAAETKANDRSALFVDRNVDVWGLGASALEMFTDQVPFGHVRGFQRGRDLREFGGNRTNQPLSDPDGNNMPAKGSVAVKTGNTQVDQLLTSMLMPDPRDRATPSELLQSPALNAKGVGSDEAKALIVALRSGDANAIDTARYNLAVKVG